MACLGTNLANGYVLAFAAMEIKKLLQLAYKEVEEEGTFELLDVLHHFTSGIKAITTDAAYYGVDEMRQARGGAGFLVSSGICSSWQEISPFPTYEGVNILMLQ